MPSMCLVHELGLAEAVGVDWSSPVTELYETPHASARLPRLSGLSPLAALSATRPTPGYTGPSH